MYEFIKGNLVTLTPVHAIIETGGIGYQILIPLSTYTDLSASIGKSTFLYLSHVVREDAQKLYGFTSEDMRNLFEKLSSISGIGPKTALSIIGHMSLESLEWALAKQDVTALSKIPGIGKKTAQRLIVELQGKLGKPSTEKAPSQSAALSQDAISALIQLGYSLDKSQKAITKTLSKVDQDIDLSKLISLALQEL